MNTTNPISTLNLVLAKILNFIGVLFLLIFIIGLPLAVYQYYRYTQGLPPFNETYETYADVYSGFLGFSLVSLSTTSFCWWLRFETLCEPKKAFFWFKVLVTVVITYLVLS